MAERNRFDLRHIMAKRILLRRRARTMYHRMMNGMRDLVLLYYNLSFSHYLLLRIAIQPQITHSFSQHSAQSLLFAISHTQK